MKLFVQADKFNAWIVVPGAQTVIIYTIIIHGVIKYNPCLYAITPDTQIHLDRHFWHPDSCSWHLDSYYNYFICLFTEATEVHLVLYNDLHVQQVFSIVSQHPELTEVLWIQL